MNRSEACRGTCTHVDCEEVKGPPECPTCHQPVPYVDGFHFHRGRGTVRVHFACYRPASELAAALPPELVVPEANKPDAPG